VNADPHRVVLAIDPGRGKVGAAVCAPGAVLARIVVSPDALAGLVKDWQARYGVTEIIMGNRTGSDEAVAALAGVIGVPLRRVEEAGTTLRARARYFVEHPPRGLRRLLPRSLQTPPEAYDDYAAVLLAEAALTENAAADRAE
jgi:RNase H-fold protein (predicted Holliday junction resolvase)